MAFEWELRDIVSSVWTAIGEAPLRPGSVRPPRWDDQAAVTATVRLSGGWGGAIRVELPARTAERIAQRLGLAAAPGVDASAAAVGALAETVADRYVPLLADRILVSAPEVSRGASVLSGFVVVLSESFSAGDDGVVVSVLQESRRASPGV